MKLYQPIQQWGCYYSKFAVRSCGASFDECFTRAIWEESLTGQLGEVQGNANEFIKSEEMSKPKSSKRKKPITSKKEDRLQKHQKSDGNDRRDGGTRDERNMRENG